MAKKQIVAPSATVGRAINLKLSLIQNAYAFLNQSLRHYRKTSRNIQEWPFAILHVTHSLELMLKQVLKNVHPILIYEDIDRAKHTVSLEQALFRMENLGIAVDEKEKINIRKAVDYRNRIIHYEFELNRFEWKKIYAQLFEFVHFFHRKHLKTEIHAQITKDNWPVEARLMLYFKNNFVVYNGTEMHKENPKDIVDAQRLHYFFSGRKKWARLRYGDEPRWLRVSPSFAEIPCHDCGVVKGQYHADGCDVEECPKCHGQYLGCWCW